MERRILGGRYQLEAQIGAGGMATLFRAHDLQLDRKVAIKLIKSSTHDLRLRFEQEAKTLARFRSPHIVAIHDFGVDGDEPFLVMELLHGQTLGEALRQSGRLPLPRVVSLADEISKGLSVIHAGGLLHRDIKPANIFLARVEPSDLAKLLDFGIATDSSAPADLAGTLVYMSPEHLRGLACDARSDLWSLAVTLYELLTGKLPFREASIAALLMKIFTERPPAPSSLLEGLPAELDAFFARALAVDPSERFPSAAALAAAFSLAAEPSRQRQVARVLVVDDEEDVEAMIRQKLRRAIRSGAVEVQFARDGAAALALLQQSPEIEAVFTDINMPVMDGLSFLGRALEGFPDLGVVIVSAYGDMGNIRQAMNRGAFDFLQKPLDLGDFENTMLRAVEHTRSRRRRAQQTQENSLLRSFVPPAVLERVLPAHLSGPLELTEIASVLAVCVRLPPRDTAAQIRLCRAFFEAAFPEILRNKGLAGFHGREGLLAVFPGPDHPARAAEAALMIQREVSKFLEPTPDGAPPFSISMATGEVRGCVVGSRLVSCLGYSFFGPAVDEALSLDARSSAGVLLSEEAASLLSTRFRVLPSDDGRGLLDSHLNTEELPPTGISFSHINHLGETSATSEDQQVHPLSSG